MSLEIIPHVVGLDTSAVEWSVITATCSSHSRTKINHLRGALNNTKKNELTAAQFFALMKGFAFELVAAGKPVDEDEMVGYSSMVLTPATTPSSPPSTETPDMTPTSPPLPTSPHGRLVKTAATPVHVVTVDTLPHVLIVGVGIAAMMERAGDAMMIKDEMATTMDVVTGVVMMLVVTTVVKMEGVAVMMVAVTVMMEEGVVMKGDAAVDVPLHPTLM